MKHGKSFGQNPQWKTGRYFDNLIQNKDFTNLYHYRCSGMRIKQDKVFKVKL